MKRRMIVIIVILLLFAALLIWTLWANRALVLTEIEVSSPELDSAFDGFKIAHVSDLHNAEFGNANAELLELIAGAEPDIIAVTGDLIDSRHTDIDAAVRFIAGASAIAPVYYVTGNHESRLDFDAIEQLLTEAGAVVLRNEAVYIERGGSRLELAGIDDPAFIRTGESASVRAEAELEGLLDSDCYTVLLAHRPELIETYAGAGAELTLSGHAHGGQVRLPLIGALYAPGQGFFPDYTAGLYTVDGAALVVSRGLGNSLIPLRFNNRPELVLVTLRSGD